MTSFVLFPRFQDIYDGEVPELKKLLANIPTRLVVAFACHINAWKHADQFNFRVDLEIFRYMIGRLPQEKRNELEERMKALYVDVASNQHVLTIYPLPHMLQLMEYAIANYQEGTFENIPPEREEDLLKAVLVLNTQAEIKSIPKNDTERKDNELDNFNSITWPFMLSTIEHTTRKELVLVIFKSFKLLEFLLSSKEFKPFLENFMKIMGLTVPSDYLKGLIGFYLFSYNKEEQHYHSNFKEEELRNQPLLAQYIRNIDAESSKLFIAEEKKMKLVRQKPIFRISEGKCFVSNWNFIIDKFFDGLKYDFFELSGIKDTLKGDDDKKWNQFTAKLGEDFNEKVIFKDMVMRYLQRNDAVCKFGGEQKDWNQDLYHRKDNHISFIEFKGASLPLNQTYDEIKSDVDNRMVLSVNDKNKAQKKAVYQLIDQIKSFHEKTNKFEDIEIKGFYRPKLLIYPVIVFTDILWRLPGVEGPERICTFRCKLLNNNRLQSADLFW